MSSDSLRLNDPWLVAVWPGMGHVALNAGYYLLAKLGMDVVAELEAGDLFDVDHVEVKGGVIQPGRRPRNRFFVWNDPEERRDLVVFLGEAQPPLGKYPFCKQLIAYARKLGVERVLTFAAMATRMHPRRRSRVFGAATDQESLEELRRLELEMLNEGQISGLNGVLLGAAAEAGLRGACLLGEMPHVFAQIPFPKASLAILEVFATMTGLELDFTELAEQAQVVEDQLSELLGDAGVGEEEPEGEDDEEPEVPTPEPEGRISTNESDRIERLFDQARRDRKKAFELKQLLDRLGVFKDYEDRFLDLFKKAS
ncbi:MAG TPA: PAC2 family protein [Gemmataceae bacterium]|nr:PAC2 family protein [Gemmataceae bacterium]